MKIYLGDAVYARCDDFGGIWPTTENGIEATNEIYLEPEVYANLKFFMESKEEERGE